jgi:hypothetical protein
MQIGADRGERSIEICERGVTEINESLQVYDQTRAASQHAAALTTVSIEDLRLYFSQKRKKSPIKQKRHTAARSSGTTSPGTPSFGEHFPHQGTRRSKLIPQVFKPNSNGLLMFGARKDV